MRKNKISHKRSNEKRKQNEQQTKASFLRSLINVKAVSFQSAKFHIHIGKTSGHTHACT